MNRKFMSILVLSIGTILSIQSVTAAKPNGEVSKEKDSIEWVHLWGFPQTREEQLERMLTTELQRRALLALQEKGYLKRGKEYVYWFDPFQVTGMREVEGGFYELDVLATVQGVIENKRDKKVKKYTITFNHNYESGFVVTTVREL
ncbi:hypothetical protein EJP77_14260 [Paenibacillus zeisoli]|uniref:DUF3888 domain-containing protein n=1 Tax=Paenibacillus zeisoli TaxID=2496267 RepID=A0A433X680_9BACL|nr:hypothetical protein [Paenibacillus zeisoli]RUT29538.1 hypothetical protein EJP77_14260 [Paenibacillus zeisoli]